LEECSVNYLARLFGMLLPVVLSACATSAIVSAKDAAVFKSTTAEYKQLVVMDPQLARLIDIFGSADASNFRYLLESSMGVTLRLRRENNIEKVYDLNGIMFPTLPSLAPQYSEGKLAIDHVRVVNDGIMITLNFNKLCIAPDLYEKAVNLSFSDTPTVPASFFMRTAYRKIGKHTAAIILSSNFKCIVAAQVRIYQTEEN